MKVKLLSQVQLFATPWTVAYQAPLSMGFPRQGVLEWGAIVKLSGVSLKQQKPGKVVIIAKGGDNRGEKQHLNHLGKI